MRTHGVHRRPNALLGLAAALAVFAAAPAFAQEDPTGSWNPMQSGSDSFTSGGAASDGVYFYLVGGNQVGAVSGFPDTNRQVRRYDPASDTWSALADLPTPAAGNAAAYFDGRIYSFGGGTFMTGATSIIAAFDIASNTWTELPTGLGSPRQGLAAATLGNRIYVTGGIGFMFSDATEEFNPADGTVTARASMPAGIMFHTLTAVPSLNRLYAATGFEGSGLVNSLYEFTAPSASSPNGSWTTRTAMPDSARYNAASFGLQNRVYVTGGTDGSMALQTTWEYNPADDTWSRRADMADSRQMHGAAAVGGLGFVYGGEGVFSCEEFTAPDFGSEAPVNRAPTASAGLDRTVEATSADGATVRLNGSGEDLDGDSLSFVWSGPFGLANGAAPDVELPLGSHDVTLAVSDGVETVYDSVTLTVSDTAAPQITGLAASPSVLSSRNRRMCTVTVSASVTDAADAAPVTEIVSVSSNQPFGSKPDWEITGAMTVKLRCERSHGETRIYTITVRSTDNSGNSAFADVTVTVPGRDEGAEQRRGDDDDDDDDDEDDKKGKKKDKKEKKDKKGKKHDDDD